MRIRNLLIFIILHSLISCSENRTGELIRLIGKEEYLRLMSLSDFDFDQSPEGFRMYGSNYQVARLLIPEYIEVNNLTPKESRNLHWHLGQIHAFNNNYQQAIKEMEQSYTGESITWKCYIDGSIAFLQRDKESLENALETLRQQENQMNIQFLEKFVKHFDASYADAYNAEY